MKAVTRECYFDIPRDGVVNSRANRTHQQFDGLRQVAQGQHVRNPDSVLDMEELNTAVLDRVVQEFTVALRTVIAEADEDTDTRTY
jgi:hypothetical protein